MIILINSSKTMVAAKRPPAHIRPPQLVTEAQQLDTELKKLSATQIIKLMHISKPLAATTHQLVADWTIDPKQQTPAIDSFAGDIYRGLRAVDFSAAERQYADQVLLILSGLYGGIRPLDTIKPYRLELMYKLKGPGFKDLYDFWQDKVAQLLPSEGPIINLTSIEYMRVIAPFVDQQRIIAPRFLTASGTAGHQTFVTVHAKVARGAFARWLIKAHVKDPEQLVNFSDLDYTYSPQMSSKQQPTFIRPPLAN